MEDERFGVGRQNPEDDVPEQGRVSRFVETIKGLFDGGVETDDDEDDDTEAGKKRKRGKSKKWRGFFRKIFGRKEATEGEEGGGSGIPLISLERVQTEDEQKAAASQESDQAGAAETPQEATKEAVPETSPDSQQELVSQTEEAAEPVRESTSSATETESEPAEEMLPPVAPETQPLPVQQPQARIENEVLYINHQRDLNEQLSQEDQAKAQRQQEAQPLVDRRARQLATLLPAAEYIARKRDTGKLREQLKKDETTIQDTAREQERQALENEKRFSEQKRINEELLRRNQENKEALKRKRPIESTPAPTVAQAELPRATQIATESLPKYTDQQTPERASRVVLAATEADLSQDERIRETEEAIARARERAEQLDYASIEKHLDRQHEALDDVQHVQQPVPIGAVLQQNNQMQLLQKSRAQAQQTAYVSVDEPLVPPTSKSSVRQQVSKIAQDDMYRSAVLNGFYTALVILSALIVVAVIR